jgi:histidinol phosphatase-like PHP family hydrolase
MKGYDFHIHSLLSDGELLPAEIAQRLSVLGYRAFAITDHADASNLEGILQTLVPACAKLEDHLEMRVLPGIEITHSPLDLLEPLVVRSRTLGAEIIVVHGETLVEPVLPGTNRTALSLPEVDILSHPGLLTLEEADLSRENGIFLELTSRKGHSLTNGHVAKVAQEARAPLLLNSDAHSPEDFLSLEMQERIAAGAGLSEPDAEMVTTVNPEKLIKAL